MSEAIERVRELLDAPGTRTRDSLIRELEGEVEPTAVTRALGKLVVAGEVEEHPEIEDAYRLAERD